MTSPSDHEHVAIDDVTADIAATDDAEATALLAREGQVEELSLDDRIDRKTRAHDDQDKERREEGEEEEEEEEEERDELRLEGEVEIRGEDDDMAQWAGQPHIKGSTESIRMALLTFALIGLQ